MKIMMVMKMMPMRMKSDERQLASFETIKVHVAETGSSSINRIDRTTRFTINTSVSTPVHWKTRSMSTSHASSSKLNILEGMGLTVTVLDSNFAVNAMYCYFLSSVLGNLSGTLECFLLSAEVA